MVQRLNCDMYLSTRGFRYYKKKGKNIIKPSKNFLVDIESDNDYCRDQLLARFRDSFIEAMKNEIAPNNSYIIKIEPYVTDKSNTHLGCTELDCYINDVRLTGLLGDDKIKRKLNKLIKYVVEITHTAFVEDRKKEQYWRNNFKNKKNSYDIDKVTFATLPSSAIRYPWLASLITGIYRDCTSIVLNGNSTRIFSKVSVKEVNRIINTVDITAARRMLFKYIIPYFDSEGINGAYYYEGDEDEDDYYYDNFTSYGDQECNLLNIPNVDIRLEWMFNHMSTLTKHRLSDWSQHKYAEGFWNLINKIERGEI